MPLVLGENFRNNELAREAASIIDVCVSCGQCIVNCPTFRLLQDDWDSPRGRINLMKEMLAEQPPSADLQLHLDRCLTCRSCEAMCPEGVRFGRLLDVTRELIEPAARRPLRERLLRRALRAVVPYRRRFTTLLRLGQALRAVLPATLRAKVPQQRAAGAWPQRSHVRTMLVWQGCVQPALAPDINAAAARVLDRCGIRLVPAAAGCCGALSHHMAEPGEALAFMRRNIDACWPQIEAGAEAIVMTASGCGAHVRDYGALLRDDPQYRDKAQRFSELSKDIAEVVAAELKAGRLPPLPPQAASPDRRIAYQSPCSLQHAQKLKGVVEGLLKHAGYKLTPVAYPFLCCGSAGSYSILQPEMAAGLRAAKMETLLGTRPKLIATANIGCLTHLAEVSPLPVKHWIELFDETLAAVETAQAARSA
ncbi:MAG: glycolate oxidase subunit GlcF [Betaproteobacteria bacterium]|nr:glycolate oxidase subunit GlcF [Betaproteobacteria bacterium]